MTHSNKTSHGLTNPFGIYVHIPFCVHKCSYCDFYSFTKYGEEDFSVYAKRVRQEIAEAAEWLQSAWGYREELSTLFFGGGTPSLLPVDLIRSIIDVIVDHFPMKREIEITLEANPETISE